MIQLKDGWRITTDGTTFILQRYLGTYTNKKGISTERYDRFTYYPTLSQAIQAYLRVEQCKYIADNDLTLREALISLQAQNQEILNSLKEILSDNEVAERR